MATFHLTKASSNAKTGPIPVSTTSADSCPDTCGMFKDCYAKKAHLNMHWRKVTSGERGMGFDDFLTAIKALPIGQLWRHNQAGDLPGENQRIDLSAVKALVRANKGKRGFTYTHKPMNSPDNLEAVEYANNNGFTVNLSADNKTEADRLASIGIAPVVVVLDKDAAKVSYTEQGRKIVVCPAQTADKITCSRCALCQKADRDYIIGFRKH